MTKSDFVGKVALITGASSGIGRATAKRFAAGGAKLMLVARDRSRLNALIAELDESSAAHIHSADLRNADERKTIVPNCLEHFGRLDILINAAGVIGGGSLGSTSRASWEEMLEINLFAVIDLMRAALPHLEATQGSIVNVSSVAGLRAFPNLIAYCVSKAAVDQLTRCVALEQGSKGVRINSVNPGVVVTELHRRSGMDEQTYAAFLEHSRETHPLGRVGQPDEVADAIAFLASYQAGWITGVNLAVDGGRAQTCLR